MGLTYPSGRTGLEPLDLEIDPGEIVVILGPNGSGKSTLLRLLATDLRPTRGSLTLLGDPVRGGLSRLRRKIAFASDTPVHFEPLTGAENAEIFQSLVPPDEDGDGFAVRDPVARRLERLLAAFELDQASQVPVSEYSFGMRRKLLLVEALSLRTRLVLLDEPSVGLDPAGVDALRVEIGRRSGEGAAVIMASNEIRQVPSWAERVLFLHRGQLIEDAPLQRLLGALKGRTRIEIDLLRSLATSPVEELSELSGVERVRVDPNRIVVDSSDAGRPLTSLVALLVKRGGRIRDIRVREPGLGDLFLTLTGVPLEETPEPPGGQEGDTL